MTFYEFVDSILKARGWTRKTLAERAGLNYPAMAAAFRRNTKSYPSTNAVAIAKTLGLPLRHFFPYIEGAPTFTLRFESPEGTETKVLPFAMTDDEAARLAMFTARPVDLNNPDEVEFSLSFDEDFIRLRNAYLRLTDKGKVIAADVVCSLEQNRKFQHPYYSTDPQPEPDPKADE